MLPGKIQTYDLVKYQGNIVVVNDSQGCTSNIKIEAKGGVG